MTERQERNLEERIKSLESENERLRKRLEQFDLCSSDNHKRILASRGLLQIVLDSIPVRLYWKDLDSKYLGCNKLFALDAGFKSLDEIIGKTDFELSWKKDADLHRADDKKVMEMDAAKLDYEETLRWPDGTELLIRTSKVPLKDKNGTVFGVMGCYEDISSYKKTEQALIENAHFLHILLNAMPNPVFYKNEKGVYTGCNRAFEDFLGRKKREIIGKDVYAFSPKELADKYFRMDKELFENPGVQKYESSVIDTSGKRHNVVFNKATFEKADGSLGGLVGVIADVTERRQNEEAIQALIESTVGKSGNDFFEKTVTKLCEWLRADCALIGELIEEHISILSMVKDGKLVSNFLHEIKDGLCKVTLKKGFCYYPQGVAALFPDEEILADIHAEGYAGVLLYDEKREPLGILCVISRDVMKLPPKAKDVLEIIAAKASIEIAHTRTFGELSKARDEAERANNAKSDFLSKMSHELRTPLTAILGFAQLLEQNFNESLNDFEKESVEEIITSGNHLHKIINELLDLANIESGEYGMSIRPVKVKAVLLDSVHLISPLAKKSGISIKDETEIADDLAVKADKSRLKQVLINLLSNAIKYNSNKGLIVITSEFTGKKRFKISISDTGYGISEEQQEQIFEPFHRNDAYLRGIDGTGIGLSVSKKYMELMNGHIGVESEPDKGSTFWIEIDLCSEKR